MDYNVPNTTNLPPIWNSSNWLPPSSSGGATGPPGAPGQPYQFTDKIFLGSSAGSTGQGSGGIAIGFEAGQTDQDINAIALGRYSGETTQGTYSIAIGTEAGRISAQPNSICIGNESGVFSAGENSIGIGSFCGGTTGISPSSIILNASGQFLSSGTTGFFVKPIRGFEGNNYVLGFNDLTNEITYENSSLSEEDLTLFSKTGIVLTGFLSGGTYTTISTVSPDEVNGIALSGSSKYMIYCNEFGVNRPLYVSSNYGATFTNTFTTIYGGEVCVSESGQYMACASNAGIYVSNNFGQTFTTISNNAYNGICMCASGKYMYASAGNSGYIYKSIDYGVSFQTVNINDTSFYTNASCSATGKYVLIGGNGNIQFSKDYGETFTIVSSSTNPSFGISPSGQYIIYMTVLATTQYFLSSDFGKTFVSLTLPSAKDNSSFSFSQSGQYVTYNGSGVWLSSNYGWDWDLVQTSTTAFGFAPITKDGTRFVWNDGSGNINYYIH
jgi:hypothetical protein